MKAMQPTAHSMNAALRESAADAAERARQFPSGSLSEPHSNRPARAPEQSFTGKRPLEEGRHNDCLKVRDIMTADVKSCRPQDTLAAAAMAMNHADCRFLEIFGSERRKTPARNRLVLVVARFRPESCRAMPAEAGAASGVDTFTSLAGGSPPRGRPPSRQAG